MHAHDTGVDFALLFFRCVFEFAQKSRTKLLGHVGFITAPVIFFKGIFWMRGITETAVHHSVFLLDDLFFVHFHSLAKQPSIIVFSNRLHAKHVCLSGFSRGTKGL